MNELYAEFEGEAGDLLTAVAAKLFVPDPYDLTDTVEPRLTLIAQG